MKNLLGEQQKSVKILKKLHNCIIIILADNVEGGVRRMLSNRDETMKFRVDKDKVYEPSEILITVYKALLEKGYNPINQIVGYILSGDPTYITSYNNARSLIRKIERDDLLEELVKAYVADKE